MVDETTSIQAAGCASYRLTRLRTAQGSIAAHYLHDKFCPDEETFVKCMEIPRFAEIIEKEERGEAIADGPLDILASLAPTEQVHDLFLEWLAFINVDLQPWTTGGSIHFRPHWARVLMLALSLGEAEGLDSGDLEKLAAAAAFHDSRRADPYLDTGHGARAAEYYRSFCGESKAGCPRETRIGRTITFDEAAYQAIYWHDRDDHDGEEAITHALSHDAPHAVHLYHLLKDADALDRVRLGESDLDTSFLRTDHAIKLLPYAKLLYAKTG